MTDPPEPGPRRIIIDTDPGQDDAVAILLALASPEAIEVLALTVVAGNVPLRHTVRNAAAVLELAGRPDIPFFAGCDRPLRRPQITAEHVHGPTGLDGPDLPPPGLAARPGHAADHLVRSLREAPAGSITLVALGPLSNVATALQRAPDIAARIRELVLMGGACFEGGNITPAAEFNIHVDPEAASIVFGAGVPIVMVPLDVTHRALATPPRIAALRALGNRAGIAVADMLGFSERFDLAKYGWPGAPLHDPCTIAWLLRPSLFSGRTVNVEIETTGAFTAGATVVDWWHVTGRPPNALYLRDLDADGFYALLTERLGRLP